MIRHQLAQLFRLLLQWAEAGSDDRDVVSQVKEQFDTTHTMLPFKVDEAGRRLYDPPKVNAWRAAGRLDDPKDGRTTTTMLRAVAHSRYPEDRISAKSASRFTRR